VGVCPNLALMTYKTDAFSTKIPSYIVEGGNLVETGRTAFHVDQPYQIAVLTDFCNECGNCVTACPTSGKPFEDKPRLYLNRAEFDAQSTNAFMVSRDGDATIVHARFDGETHAMSINGSMEYSSPSVSASFDASFGLIAVDATDAASEGDEYSLEAAATIFAVWKGINDSMPEIPLATDTGTRLSAPTFPS
jgi:putative selenate reductase